MLQALQDGLLLPRPAAVRLLVHDPVLIPMNWRAVESQIQRISKALGQTEQRQQLGEVLAALEPAVLLSDTQQLVQQVRRGWQPLPQVASCKWAAVPDACLQEKQV